MVIRNAIMADAICKGPGGKKYIMGVFRSIGAISFPLRHDKLSLFIQIEASPSEAGRHLLELSVVDGDYNEKHRFNNKRFNIPVPPPNHDGGPCNIEYVAEISNLTVDQPGHYYIRIKIDGRHLGDIPFVVNHLKSGS